MKTRRLAVTGLALVATLSFGVAGCNTGTGTSGADGGTSAAPQLTAAEELAAAAKKLNQDTVAVAMRMTGLKSDGAMDPAGKKAKMTMDISANGESMKIEMVALDTDLYMKMAGAPGLPKTWMRIDATKVKEGSTFDFMPDGDASGANNLVNSMVTVERDGERSFKGSMDITKSRNANQESLKTLGDKAKAIPFTAKVDDQGRLIEITVDMKSVLASLGEMKTTYSNFGEPVEVSKPAGSVTDAPQSLLDAFGV